MDFESFFGSPRWKILEVIAKKPSSPIEIAAQVNTSVSYVSQQLKLLEVARIVGKQRTGKADKGQPRSVFSLAQEYVYLTALTKNSPKKRLLPLSEQHKSVLSIWLIENVAYHSILQKLYWGLEEDFSSISYLGVEEGNSLKIYLASENKNLKSKAESILKKSHEKFEIVFLNKGQSQKIPTNVISLHSNLENGSR